MAVISGPLRVSGNSIRVMRVVRGLSQRRLGELARITPARIFKIEHGLTTPREEEIAKLLGALTTE